MYSKTPSDPLGPWGKEKTSCLHYDSMQGEAKLQILKLTLEFHQLCSVGPKQLCMFAHLECTCEAGIS